jgi:uncharacterized protein YqgC (DUF456 family)
LEIHDILAGLVVLAGLVGIVVPVLPGMALQAVAVAFWAFEESNLTSWLVLGLVLVVAVAASVLKYLFPGKQLKATGVPGWVLLSAVLAGIIGLFVIPVVGGPIGFVLTIYGFERARKGKALAWPSTKGALRAVLTSMGIELAGGFTIAVTFLAGALLT